MGYPDSSSGFHSDYQKIWSAISAIAVNVASTDQTLTQPSRGIYIGGAGNLVCRLAGDTSDVTFTGLVAGTVYPFSIISVTKANTTITNSTLLF